MSATPRAVTKHALRYAELGFRPIAVWGVTEDGVCHCSKGAKCKTPGKHPIEVGWKNATSDAGAAEKTFARHHGCNIGLAMGQGVVAVDIDNEYAAEALEDRGLPTETPTQRTGGGGQHRLFHYADSASVKNEVRFINGADIRSDGGQIVVEPSVSAKGAYAWDPDRGPGTPMAELPQWIVDLCQQGAADRPPLRVEDLADGLPDGERNNKIFRYACRMRRDFRPDVEVMAVCLEFARRCNPPLSEDEVREIVASSARYEEKPPPDRPDAVVEDWSLDEAYAEPPETPEAPDGGEQREADRFEDAVEAVVFTARTRAEAQRRLAAEAEPPEPFDAALLSSVVIEPVRWRVDGVLPAEGRLLVAAQRKTGKTTLALNLARALILGCDFLGHFHVHPVTGNVAFLNFEVSKAQCCLWAIEANVPGDRLLTVHLRGRRNPFADADDTARLADLLREYGVEVLIVDPFGRAFSGVSQNDASEVGAFLAGLDRLTATAGVSELVLTTHAGWDGERSRGSSALEDWADAVVYLTRGKDDDKLRYFRAIGRDVEVDEDLLAYDPETRRLALTGEGSRAAARVSHRNDELADAIVEAVGREPGANSGRLQDLLKDAGFGLHRGEAGKAAKEAAARGLITRKQGKGNSFQHYPIGVVSSPRGLLEMERAEVLSSPQSTKGANSNDNKVFSTMVPGSPQVVPGDFVSSPHHPIGVGGLVTTQGDHSNNDREPGGDDDDF